ncbi:hypothetical protein HY933_02630 [Candidatus Falkowbacteria bacterium]|nr:hypothetical protein [Candidatus Falkowbacteria bacterium]
MFKKHLLQFFFLFCLAFLIVTPALAQGGWTEAECKQAGNRWYANTCIAKAPELDLEVPFGQLTSGKIDISKYIENLYTFGVGAAGVLAVIVIMVAGFIWLTAGGNQENIGTAKGYITGALIGLIIALGSYTVMRIINPSLVIFAPLRIPAIKQAYLSDFCPEKVPTSQETINCTDPTGQQVTLKSGDEIKCGWRCQIGSGDNQNNCTGMTGPNGKLCLPLAQTDKSNNLIFDNQLPSGACKNFNDDFTSKAGLPEEQSTCQKINDGITTNPKARITSLANDERGSCVWINIKWLSDLLAKADITNTLPTDGCYWCDQNTYNIISGELAAKISENHKTKYEVCNGLFTGIGWTQTKQVCMQQWCFIGGPNPVGY